MAQRILRDDGKRKRESISVVAHCLYDRKDVLCRRNTAVLGMEVRENCVASCIITSSNSYDIHSNPFHGDAASDPTHGPATACQRAIPIKVLNSKHCAHPLDFLCKVAFFIFLKQFSIDPCLCPQFFILWTFSVLCNMSLC